GLVTGDGFAGFREILLRGRGAVRTTRATEAPRPDVASRFGLRRVPLHLLRKSSSLSVFPSGRWSLIDAPGVFGEPLRADERAEAWARILLARWGVVSRAAL